MATPDPTLDEAPPAEELGDDLSDAAVPLDLLELYEVLEYQAAVEGQAP